jgi:probable HAF family extracellular repeat protein
MKNLFIGTAIMVVANSSAIAYELSDLGVNIEPRAINNLGVIVGSISNDQYSSSAFRGTSAQDIELIEGTSANAVNDSGQIAGSTVSGAFVLDGNNYREWSDYGAFGINQAGSAAGYSVGNNPYQPRSLPYNPAIFDGNQWNVFDIANLYPRGTSDGVYADRFILNSINDYGYSVGYKYRYGLAGSSAILIAPDAKIHDSTDVTYLSVPAGGKASDINNSNMIVGTSGSTQAYILDYNTGNLTTLPLLDGGLRSNAYDINEHDQVVGSSETLEGSTPVNHAVLWDQASGVPTDLNTDTWLSMGWVLASATAINDNGDIVGTGYLNGEPHGFLLTNGAVSAPPPAQNQQPVAVASADTYAGKAPLVVTFDSSGSTDPDGTIVGYSWDFMDGSPSTEPNPMHEFTVPGSYLVTLTVTDDKGMQGTSTIDITVRKGKGNNK